MPKLSDSYFTAVQTTITEVNQRFAPEAKDAALHAANALMLSRCLDLLVQAGVLTEEQRSNGMQRMYREIGVL